MSRGSPSLPSPPSLHPLPHTHTQHNRSYIPSLIPHGVDPAKVDSKMFYNYIPNAVKTRKRTSQHQLSVLEDVFLTDKKPNGPRRRSLADELRMTPREVQVRALLFLVSISVLRPSLGARPALPFPPQCSSPLLLLLLTPSVSLVPQVWFQNR